MTSKRIEIIIAKYLINQASFEELDDLEAWIKEPHNEQEFLNYVKVNFSIDYNLRITDTDKTKKLISTLIKKEKRQIRVRRIQRYSKYAAVFIIALFLTGFFFRDSLFGTLTDNQIIPEIVNTNTIEPGTDKATLTLEDGSVVVLEKGESLQTQNAKSNGEQIVYNNVNSTPDELVFNYLNVPRGGQFFIKLSDGTKVWLNSESQLKYPVNFIDGKTRQVELVYGEAYFDVSPNTENKGSKFVVFNNAQEVEVLGTEFNIKAYKDETNIYTTLVEGKVAVNFENKMQNLTPNQQSSFNLHTRKLSIKEVDVYNEVSWKEGVFSFDGKSIQEVMKVLSRWFDVNVVFENKISEDLEFVGVLRKNKTLEDILSNIKNSGGIIDYKIKGDMVILK